MTYEATHITGTVHAALTDGNTEKWSRTYHAFTQEELLSIPPLAIDAFNRVARDWIEINPIRVGVIGTDICISFEPIAGDGDDMLEFEVPIADVIMTSPEWDPADAAPLAALLRQLADQLEAATDKD